VAGRGYEFSPLVEPDRLGIRSCHLRQFPNEQEAVLGCIIIDGIDAYTG
jgi:hypothetical protein